MEYNSKKMISQVFYRKWRPQTLAEVVGQEQVTQTLLNALRSGRIAHAYLFCGPRGTGKTSTGRILAKAINCLNNGQGEPCNTCSLCQSITEGRALDVIEIDAASNRRIDEIRDLREKVNYAPNQARFKVYIIDEVHMLTNEASNALLKTLEEPPPHVIFVLATTETHKVLPTIISRCQHFDFRRLSQADIVSKLTLISQAEDIKIEPEALRLIARSATGSLRDAENILQQLTTYYGSKISLKQVQALLGITGDERAKELIRYLIEGDIAAAVTTVHNVNSDGLDLRQFNRGLVEYLRALLLVKTASEETLDLTPEEIAELKDLAAKANLTQILRAVKLFGQLELGLDHHSTLPLELALVDSILTSDEEKESHKTQTEPIPHQPAKAATTPVEPPSSEIKPAEAELTAESVATPEPATFTPPQPGNEIKELKSNWKGVTAQAPEDTKRTSAIAILRSAGVKPVAFENDTVTLAFKYPYHKEKIEEVENQKIVEKILSHYLGRSLKVRCIYQPEDNHLVREAQKLGAQIIDKEN